MHETSWVLAALIKVCPAAFVRTMLTPPNVRCIVQGLRLGRKHDKVSLLKALQLWVTLSWKFSNGAWSNIATKLILESPGSRWIYKHVISCLSASRAATFGLLSEFMLAPLS